MTDFSHFDLPDDRPAGARSLNNMERLVAGQPVQGEREGLDYADIGKGFAGGVGRGTAGLVGGAGTVGGLIRSGLEYAGVPEGAINAARNVAQATLPPLRAFSTPDAQQVQGAMEGVTGKFYEPQTVPGQYASTLGEFLPGTIAGPSGGARSIGQNIAGRALNWAIPALTSETAGQITRGSAAEPWARAIAGPAAGLVAGKVITPTAPAAGRYREAVDVVENAGIPLKASERTGSEWLRRLEASAADMPLSARAAQELEGRGKTAYDAAITNRVFNRNELAARGIDAAENLPGANVYQHGLEALGDRYNAWTNAYRFHNGPTLQRDLAAAEARYNNRVLPSQRTNDVAELRDDITNALLNAPGRGAAGGVPGTQYQSWRSNLATLARDNQGNTALRDAFTDMKRGLDRAMQRRLPPQVARDWADTNTQYALARQLEGAVAKGGEHLSPQAVATAMRTGRRGAYARGQGDLDELASAANMVMKPFPNSGTGARTMVQQLVNLPNAIGGTAGAALGTILGVGPIVGGLAGAAIPHAATRAAMSRLGQAYLGNRALPQNASDILAQTGLQQATTQPAIVARNRREQEDYERRRAAQRRALGY